MRWLAGALADLADLVLPTPCAGCAAGGGRLRRGVCGRCAAALTGLVPGPTRPVPAPAGLPPVVALGAYEGPLRGVLLAYKEKGRHGLAGPLGRLLAEAVAAAVTAGDGAATGGRRPLLLLPVPSTAAAARQRHGDHLVRLARHARRRLLAAGWSVAVARPLAVRPRPDSAGLTGPERLAVAQRAFRVRPRAAARCGRWVADGARVVVLDDIVTTGATLAAMSGVLAGAGLPVTAAAVLAATARRGPGPAGHGASGVSGRVSALGPHTRGKGPANVYRRRGDGIPFSG